VKTASRISTIVALTLLCAMPALAQKVKVDWDRELDMSGWKTYGWADDSIKPEGDIARSRVEDALRDAFEAKGMELAQDQPDFLIRYHAIVDEQTKQSSVRIGLGVSRRVGSRGAVSIGSSTSPKAHTVEVGTLVVDVVDARSGKVAWTAEGSDTLKGDPEKRRAQIDKALAKALQDFPPRPK
jgi:hypothetical protein